MKVIINSRIITPETILDGHEVVIERDRIARIQLQGSESHPAHATIIDAQGGWLSPGFIDIHSDYIEHMAAPRPTCLMDFDLAIHETERELITHGITTMFHSLSIIKSTEFPDKPIRDARNTGKFIALIERSHHSCHLIRHRFHARFEIDSIDRLEEIADYIRDRKVHLLSFMDHTPGQGQYRDLENYKATLKGYRSVTDEEVDSIIEHSRNRPKITLEKIQELCKLAQEHGIAVASHDDDSVEKLHMVKSFGITISEFPVSLDIARQAHQMGLYTLAGAPNVLLGGSHNGNLAAADAVSLGCADILCSDYYPAALLHSVFHLHRRDGHRLADVIRLVTINPARAVGMDALYGSIEISKKADLLVIREGDGHLPVITDVLVDGVLSYQAHYRSH